MIELNLDWRYATKEFDSAQKLNDQQVHQLVECIRLAPTSYGMQPIHVKVISQQSMKENLREVSFGQSQISDCSHLFVFCIQQNTSEVHVDEYMDRLAKTRKLATEALSGYGGMIKGFLSQQSSAVKDVWAARQAYLCLGFLLHTCALLKIDACPIEGFVPESYDHMLGLTAQGLSSVVVAAVGFRSAEDVTQHQAKVRKSTAEMFDFI